MKPTQWGLQCTNQGTTLFRLTTFSSSMVNSEQKEGVFEIFGMRMTEEDNRAFLSEYELPDHYLIEGYSRKSVPTFQDHPLFKSWNIRDGYKSDKIGDQPVKVEIEDSDDARNDW